VSSDLSTFADRGEIKVLNNLEQPIDLCFTIEASPVLDSILEDAEPKPFNQEFFALIAVDILVS